MAGVIQVVLTDSDLARILRWGGWMGEYDAADLALYQRLRQMHEAVACTLPPGTGPRHMKHIIGARG